MTNSKTERVARAIFDAVNKELVEDFLMEWHELGPEGKRMYYIEARAAIEEIERED